METWSILQTNSQSSLFPIYPFTLLALKQPLYLLIRLAPRNMPFCSLTVLTFTEIAPGLTLVQVACYTPH